MIINNPCSIKWGPISKAGYYPLLTEDKICHIRQAHNASSGFLCNTKTGNYSFGEVDEDEMDITCHLCKNIFLAKTKK